MPVSLPKQGKKVVVRPRIRATRGGVILIGPGKADLLAAIEGTGSIRNAAEQIGMSYMRAWSLVRTMNKSFHAPLVERTRGGPKGGGAELTKLGARVLALYQEMERRAAKAIAPVWRRMMRELRP
jgi:molybdate transport system regulatory protein